MGWTSFGSISLPWISSTIQAQSASGATSSSSSSTSSSRLAVRMSTPASLEDRVAQGDALPRCLEVDRATAALDHRRPQHLLDHGRDHLLGEGHHALVAGAAEEPLEHRELGAVLRREALVAEEPAQLVDVLEAADDRPLQVELGRGAQEQLAVERVVVRGEGTSSRAAGEGLQDRRFHLDEVMFVQVGADRGDQLRPHREHLARALVGHQVEFALAVADLRVGDAVEEVGRVAQRLAQHRALAHGEGELAALGHVEVALDADRVADVEGVDPPEGLLAERVDAGVGLDLPGQVADVEEDRLAVAAATHHPAGDPVGEPRLLTLFELLGIVRSVDRGDLVAVREPGSRIGLDPFGAQPLQLLAADGLGGALRGLGPRRDRAHGARPTVTRSSPR